VAEQLKTALDVPTAELLPPIADKGKFDRRVILKSFDAFN
jgi:hypothetical protein